MPVIDSDRPVPQLAHSLRKESNQPDRASVRVVGMHTDEREESEWDIHTMTTDSLILTKACSSISRALDMLFATVPSFPLLVWLVIVPKASSLLHSTSLTLSLYVVIAR